MKSLTRLQALLIALISTAIVVGGAAVALRQTTRQEGAAAATTTSVPAVSPGAAPIETRRQQLIGVRTTRASRGTLDQAIRTTGTVQYDETGLTDVNLKLDGWISKLHVTHVGQHVERGQPLLALYSPDLLAAQNDLIVALRNREQVTQAQAADAREYGARLVEAPRQRLLRWDVPEDQLREIAERREALPAVIFRSPAQGVVIQKNVINGMHVEAGETLYRLADLSTVWVEAELRESELGGLRVGATASVTVDAWPNLRLSGQVVHVNPYLSEQTRTVKARIALVNRGGQLKPGMFATVELRGDSREGWLIPADAVVDSGTRQTVFVSRGSGHFEPRRVVVAARGDGQALIVEGLQGDEEVVERGKFFLDSESQAAAGLASYGAAEPSTGTHPAAFDIRVHTVPAPPQTGETVVQVEIRDVEKRPVTDVEVGVLFSMPAMPTMSMPAMRAEGKLQHIGNGVFRGPVSIPMAGRWDITVTVLRQGHQVATSHSSVLAR